jgi:hypothetical protein
MLDLVWDFFESPADLAGAPRADAPMALGVACFLIGGLSAFLARALPGGEGLLGFSWPVCVLLMSWRLVSGFALACIVHMIADFSGASGRARGLFVLFGFAELSWALAVPLALIGRAFGASHWAATAFFSAVWALNFTLRARAVRDNYGVSAGRAWFFLALPYLAVAALAVSAVSLAAFELIQRFL